MIEDIKLEEGEMPWYHDCFDRYVELSAAELEIQLSDGYLSDKEYLDYMEDEYNMPLSFIKLFMRYAVVNEWQYWWDFIKVNNNLSLEDSVKEFVEGWTYELDYNYNDEMIASITKHNKNNNIT